MKPKNIKALQSESRDLQVRVVNRRTLVVESLSDPQGAHIVEVDFRPNNTVHAQCTCEWSQFRGVACKHVMAALEFLAEQKGRTLSFWLSVDDARRQKHRTFTLVHGNQRTQPIWITSRTG